MKLGMKKKVLFITLVCILFAGILGGIMFFFYNLQYNSNHIGRYLSIEIDDSGLKEIAQIDNTEIMTYDLKMPYVVSAKAESINLDQALELEMISMEDLCKYAKNVKKKQVGEREGVFYSFENYQIIFCQQKYLITPLNKEFSHSWFE